MICAAVESCAGIDVGKKWLSVCVMTGPLNGEARVEMQRFGVTVAELERLRDWFVKQAVTHVVMESTGSYWKPVFNVLEDSVKVYLANPLEVKTRKGHKTDDKDGWWLAHLLRHAMIHPSFIPPRAIRELRDLTRRRTKLHGAGTAEKNRVQKTLEDANVKLGNVLSDVFGTSGQLMLEALLTKRRGSAGTDRRVGQGSSQEKDPRHRGSPGGASDERAPSQNDSLQHSAHAISRRPDRGDRSRDRCQDSGGGTGEAVGNVADRAWCARTQCRQYSGGDRCGYDAVSLAAKSQFLGWRLSGKQPECGKESQQPYHRRQPLAAWRPHRMRLGGSGQKRLFHPREVLATYHQGWREEELGTGRGGSHYGATSL